MGWGDCGTDTSGRPIGYLHQGTCDHPGCTELIDRGLSYACGGMHGEDEVSCGKYFCSDHLSNCVEIGYREYVHVCSSCYQALIDSGEWAENDSEECLVRSEA